MNRKKHTMVPRETQTFKMSKIALSIVVASLLLATLVLIMTTSSFKREQALMERFLLKEGMTLIRSFEAGTRTSMMHFRRGDDPLNTLVSETTRTDNVAYIHIIDEQGRVVAEAGKWPQTDERPDVSRVLSRDNPITTLIASADVFEVACIFQPLADIPPQMKSMHWRWMQNLPEGDSARKVIYIGLHTTEFNQAREQDVKHSLIMAGILFLVGCAGLYFLFLYQGIRVSRSTLANMELYTENVIESMPVGLITLDRMNQIVSCNAKAEELVCKPFSALVHKNIEKVFPHWPGDFWDQGKALLDAPLDCPLDAGEQVPVKVSCSRLYDQDGKELGSVLILRDLREIRALEQQLERSRRLAALGQMAAGIAHEIRNPLGTLRGFAQYFSRQFDDDENGREYAGLMIGEVDRLNHSISALLQFARPRDPDFQDIDTCALLTKAAKLLEQDCTDQQLALHLDCQEGVGMKADPDLLLQVLINLMKNSMAVTQAGDSIELGSCRYEGGVRIWVKDTGTGMSKDELEKMFDPFYTTRKSGTGLGLAVSHQIVEQHHGRFEVASDPEEGTRIDIMLPTDGQRGSA
jgi:two-component system sensor histidine kinase HydH